MKILFVANGDEKANGRFFYSPDRKIAHGMIQNGHHVWFFSDRDIARNSTFFKTRKLGVKKCNERFILTFKNLIPDLVVLGNSKIITNSSLEEVRKIHPSVRIIQFNVDAIFNKNLEDSMVAGIGRYQLDWDDEEYLTASEKQYNAKLAKHLSEMYGYDVTDFSPENVAKMVDNMKRHTRASNELADMIIENYPFGYIKEKVTNGY